MARTKKIVSRTRKAKTERKLTTAQRQNQLEQFVAICFTMWDGTHTELAKKAQLHLSTVYRLFNGDYSLRMRVNTLQCLAYAVGLRLDVVECGTFYVTLVK